MSLSFWMNIEPCGRNIKLIYTAHITRPSPWVCLRIVYSGSHTQLSAVQLISLSLSLFPQMEWTAWIRTMAVLTSVERVLKVVCPASAGQGLNWPRTSRTADVRRFSTLSQLNHISHSEFQSCFYLLCSPSSIDASNSCFLHVLCIQVLWSCEYSCNNDNEFISNIANTNIV